MKTGVVVNEGGPSRSSWREIATTHFSYNKHIFLLRYCVVAYYMIRYCDKLTACCFFLSCWVVHFSLGHFIRCVVFFFLFDLVTIFKYNKLNNAQRHSKHKPVSAPLLTMTQSSRGEVAEVVVLLAQTISIDKQTDKTHTFLFLFPFSFLFSLALSCWNWYAGRSTEKKEKNECLLENSIYLWQNDKIMNDTFILVSEITAYIHKFSQSLNS